MDLDYFVLNVKKKRSPFESANEWSGTILGGTLEAPKVAPGHDAVQVSTTKLTEKQAEAAAKDPANTLAPVMPVALIAPASLPEYGILSDGDPMALAQADKSSWGIGATGADKSTRTGDGVVVAILDTGIDAGHEAFKGVDLTTQNFSGGDSAAVADAKGHGTHCAGTVFGRDVGGTRIGIAQGVKKAIIGKVLDDEGRGSTAAVLKALHWAAGEGANVVSLSLGFDFPGMAEQIHQVGGLPEKLAMSKALKAYRDNLRMFDTLLAYLMLENPVSPGLIVVAASGNESLRNINPDFVIDASLPAAASPNILSVGAVRRNGALFDIAPFSNINPVVSAPGVDIVSAKVGGGLQSMSGTSMACPHVAGLAALWWQQAAAEGAAKAGTVRARIIAAARMTGFPDTVGPVDRGVGMAMAPA